MRKIALCVLVSASQLIGSEPFLSPEKCSKLAEKVVAQDATSSEGYFAFDDGSCWQVSAFKERTKGWGEWFWSLLIGEGFVPADYLVPVDQWEQGDAIDCFDKNTYLISDHVVETNAYNQHDLASCTWVLWNRTKEAVLFGEQLGHEVFEKRVQSVLYLEGKEAGHEHNMEVGRQGARARWKETEHDRELQRSEIYAKGWKEGQKTGYVQGKQDEMARLQKEHHIRLEQMQEAGYHKGYEEGYQRGRQRGSDACPDRGVELDQAYQKGFYKGKGEGYQAGVEKTRQEMYQKGWEIGYAEGKAQGRRQGRDDRAKEDKDKGYTVGLQEGHQEGYREAFAQPAGSVTESYRQGREAGYQEGYLKGAAAGKKERKQQEYNRGQSEGYQEGYAEGCQDAEGERGQGAA